MLSLFEKPNKSKGADPDGISSQLIIDCADLIAPHIILVHKGYSSIQVSGERLATEKIIVHYQLSL